MNVNGLSVHPTGSRSLGSYWSRLLQAHQAASSAGFVWTFDSLCRSCSSCRPVCCSSDLLSHFHRRSSRARTWRWLSDPPALVLFMRERPSCYWLLRPRSLVGPSLPLLSYYPASLFSCPSLSSLLPFLLIPSLPEFLWFVSTRDAFCCLLRLART